MFVLKGRLAFKREEELPLKMGRLSYKKGNTVS
jgi:hypothetical protein